MFRHHESVVSRQRHVHCPRARTVNGDPLGPERVGDVEHLKPITSQVGIGAGHGYAEDKGVRLQCAYASGIPRIADIHHLETRVRGSDIRIMARDGDIGCLLPRRYPAHPPRVGWVPDVNNLQTHGPSSHVGVVPGNDQPVSRPTGCYGTDALRVDRIVQGEHLEAGSAQSHIGMIAGQYNVLRSVRTNLSHLSWLSRILDLDHLQTCVSRAHIYVIARYCHPPEP